MGRIDVVATTPLPGLGTSLERVPANVQVFGTRDLARYRGLALPDVLERGTASAALLGGQGNPFQPDITYRGFTASPLLGTPQGVAVFQDGVRINELFGDFVNWDLVPQAAVASLQVIPGTPAAFGPNTLGAAVGIHTKSGTQFPGGALEALAGSWRRVSITAEQGVSAGAWDGYAMAHALDDDGWARHNASRIRQLFAKVGHQTDQSDLDASITIADNTLEGTQLLPRSFFDDIRQPYTYPDRIRNRLAFGAMKGSRFLAPGLLVEGNAYVRDYHVDNLSSNLNDDAESTPAVNDRTTLEQLARGAGFQVTHGRATAAGEFRIVAGSSIDVGDTRFTRLQQPATLDGTRRTVGTGPFETTTQLDSHNRLVGAFFSGAADIAPRWLLTVTARYNQATVSFADRLGSDPGLDASHRFERVSPAAGLNFNPGPGFTSYVSGAQSVRFPTPVELTCADPAVPCKLPTNFLSDPPLKPIRATTWEWGARGATHGITWNGALYRTGLADDIQFVSSGAAAATTGYFRNVGATRRQGAEVAASGALAAWRWELRYGYVDARFRSAFVERSPANSTADANGEIVVEAGNRIPGIARHNFKSRLAYSGERWDAGATVVARSSLFARGDENNRDGGGPVAGFAVVNLDARWEAREGLELFLRVDNLFDRRSATSGVLGENFFANPAHAYDPSATRRETFLAPAAPRGAWIGLRIQWR